MFLLDWNISSVSRAIHNGVETEMTLFLKIALFCTSTSQVNRPTMREAIAMMIDAKESLSNCSSSPISESPLDEGTSRGKKKIK
ncbi:hypothetical protein ACFX2J_004196 [Malus domestica]